MFIFLILLRLPQVDKDLAYLKEGTRNFDDYVFAVTWAQKFARLNRDVMMSNVLKAAHACSDLPAFEVDPTSKAVNCHHNYVNVETHFGKEVYLTRKGAVSKAKPAWCPLVFTSSISTNSILILLTVSYTFLIMVVEFFLRPGTQQ